MLVPSLFSVTPLLLALPLGRRLVDAVAAEPSAARDRDRRAPGSRRRSTKVFPLKPDVLLQIGEFTVTNSMVVTWVVAAGIIIFAQMATRNIQAGAGTAAESLGMAGRKSLQFSRERDRLAIW